MSLLAHTLPGQLIPTLLARRLKRWRRQDKPITSDDDVAPKLASHFPRPEGGPHTVDDYPLTLVHFICTEICVITFVSRLELLWSSRSKSIAHECRPGIAHDLHRH